MSGTLTERLRSAYALDVRSVHFLTYGFDSACYAVECADGTRFFLKRQGGTRTARIFAARAGFYLPATWMLHYEGVFCNLTYPIKAAGGTFKVDSVDSGGQPETLILFNWVDGEMPESLTADDALPEIARLVAAFHQSPSKLRMPPGGVEQFGIPFEGDLLACMGALHDVGPGDSAGKRALRDLLLPREGDIVRVLARLRELQALARSRKRPSFLCHTDIHKWNVLVDERGEYVFLDWEGAALAPPEHDLIFFTGDDERFAAFLRHYDAHFTAPPPLDADLFNFYFHRRNLEDLTDWLWRILYENAGDARDFDDIEGIKEDCAQWWPHMEAGAEAVRRVLARRD